MNPAPQKRSPRLLAQERQIKALELKLKGYSLDEIGKRLGITHAGARALIVTALSRWNEGIQQLADRYRLTELERLEKLHEKWWPHALGEGGWGPPDVKAAEVVLKIMDRRARLLGLDAPMKVEADLDFGLDKIIEAGRQASRGAGRYDGERQAFLESKGKPVPVDAEIVTDEPDEDDGGQEVA